MSSIPGPIPAYAPGTTPTIPLPPLSAPPPGGPDTLEQTLQILGPDGKPVVFDSKSDEFSISVFMAVIQDALQKLRDELNSANRSDSTHLTEFYRNIIGRSFLNNLYDLLSLESGGWQELVNNTESVINVENATLQSYQSFIDDLVVQDGAERDKYESLRNTYAFYFSQVGFGGRTPEEIAAILSVFNTPNGADLAVDQQNITTDSLNTILANLAATLATAQTDDQAQIDAVNTQLDIYNNTDLSLLTQPEIDQLVADTNAAIATYNNYVVTRNSNLDAQFANVETSINTYNDQTGIYNLQVEAINMLRQNFGYMDAYPTNLPAVPNNPVTYDNLTTLSLVTGVSSEQPVPLAILPPPPSGDPITYQQPAITPLAGALYSFEEHLTYVTARNAALQTAQANMATATGIYRTFKSLYEEAVAIINPIRQQYGLGPPDYVNSILSIPTNPIQYQLLSQFPLPDGTNSTLPPLVPILTPNGSALDYVQFPNPVSYIPGEEDILAQALLDTALEESGVLDIMNALVEGINREIDRQQELNLGFDITLPLAFIQRQPLNFLRASGGSSGFGVGSFSVSLFSPNMAGILALSIYQSFAQINSIPVPPRFFDQIGFATLKILTRVAVQGTTQALRILGPRLSGIALASPAVRTLLGVSATSLVAEAIATGVIQNIINRDFRSFIRAVKTLERAGALPLGLEVFTKASVGQLAAYTRAIAAGASLSLLGVSIANLSLAISLPSLSGQFISLLKGIDPIDLIAANSLNGAGLREVLNNPLSLLFIKSNLREQLLARGFLGPFATTVANTALDNVTRNGLAGNDYQIREALRREFLGLGFSPLDAIRTANFTSGLIRSETGGSLLDAIFKNSLDPQEAAKQAVADRITQDRENVAQIVRASIERTLENQRYETQREFRDALALQILGQGIGLTAANALANSVATLNVLGLVPPPFGISGERLATLQGALGSPVIDATLARGPFASEAEFLSVLRSETLLSNVRGGGSLENATNAFNEAVSLLVPAPLSQSAVSNALYSHLVANLSSSLSPAVASKVARSTLFTLFGNLTPGAASNDERDDPLSTKFLMERAVSQLKSAFKNQSDNKFRDLFKDFAKYNPELMAMNDHLLNPPSTLIGSLASATKEKRSIDFLGAG